MKNLYSDFITRLLLHPRKLERLFPTEPNDYEQIIRVRETPDSACLAGGTIKPEGRIGWIRGGVFYWFDALEEALQHIGAELDPNSCYWRAMIFRRMGDIENARNQFLTAGPHPVFNELHARCADECPTMTKQYTWDPYVLLTMAEQQRFGCEDNLKELVTLQQIEFSVLFRYSWEQSVLPRES